MKSRVIVGLALVVVLLITGAGMLACAEEKAGAAPDLTGQWRLDPKRSDTMKPPGDSQKRGGGGEGMSGGPPGGGPPGGGGGFGGGPPGGGGGGFGGGPPGDADASTAQSGRSGGAPPRPLPDLMHVTDTGPLISFEDSTGSVIQEISVTATEKDTLVHAPGAQVLLGQWKESLLTATRSGKGSMKVTQTITMEADTALIVRTKLEGTGKMPASEFKRYYRRVKTD